MLITCLALASYYAHKRFLKPNRISHQPPTSEQLNQLIANKNKSRYLLGTNTNEIREDNSSIPFSDLFKSSIPFADTHPWLSGANVEYNQDGWPVSLNWGGMFINIGL